MRVHPAHQHTVTRWAIIALAIALILLIASVAAACPTCKDGLAQHDPHGQAVAAGYYYSILFMMAMPFAILGTFGGMAYLSVRRARRDGVAPAADERQG